MGSKILKGVVAFLFAAVTVLSVGGYYLYTELQTVKKNVSRVDTNYYTVRNPDSDVVETSDEVTVITDDSFYYSDCVDCEEAIGDLIDSAITQLPASETVTITETVSTPKSTQTSYVPLGSTAGSTSTEWYTIDDSSGFIDLANDFSEDAYVTFEASLKVKHGNGQAFARLWDDTNNVAVSGSEISTSSNMNYEYAKSNRIYLWNGNNNYKVQLKSLNGFEVTYTNAKVKVVY